jgi:hypothetical protein
MQKAILTPIYVKTSSIFPNLVMLKYVLKVLKNDLGFANILNLLLSNCFVDYKLVRN